MEPLRYTYKTNESFLDYEFISEGPKGSIRKVVHFTQVTNNVFNLGFGDLDEKTGEINDTAVTNNNDSRKVLATVAATIRDFSIEYPDAWIIARGSTLSRTRLYRMAITNYWEDISMNFEVFGLNGNAWEPFEIRRDYEAFLIRPK